MQAVVAQEAPFDHGRQQMKLLADPEVTTKAVERTAEAIGEDIAAREQQQIQRGVQLDLPMVLGEPIPILYIQMDGTGMPVVHDRTQANPCRRISEAPSPAEDVVHQVKISGPAEHNELEIYVPISQNPWFAASIAVRTAGDPIALAPAVNAAIARVDKEQAVTRVRTMDEVAAQSTAQPRFRAQLLGSFGALALLLAAIGIFGVLAFSVSQRTREFGIRMALGARSADVLRMVVANGLRITLIGIAIGLAGAAALTRLMAALLYGVQSVDPVTFLATPLLLATVALLASAVPALRASRVDPADALRQE